MEILVLLGRHLVVRRDRKEIQAQRERHFQGLQEVRVPSDKAEPRVQLVHRLPERRVRQDLKERRVLRQT